MTLYGNQEPTFQHHSPNAVDFSDSVKLERFMKAYGGATQLDEWQKATLRQWLARDSNGMFANKTCGISAPRQNGKSALIEALVLYKLIVLKESLIVTSHLLDTTKSTFSRICAYLDNPDIPELSNQVALIRRANGQLTIEMKNGAKAYFQARNDKAGRGKTVHTIISDEAQEFTEDSNAALLPTISAMPNSQVFLLGTPDTGTSNSEVFAKIRETAHKQKSTILSYVEWAAGIEDDPTNPKVWARVNPAMGYRISQANIEGELESFKDERRFQIERLGVWFGNGGQPVIDEIHWATLGDKNSKLDDEVSDLVLAVDVSPARTTATIAVAGRRSDGKFHVEIIDHRADGTAWIVPRLKELTEKYAIRTVVIDAKGPASSLGDQMLKIRGLKVQKTGYQDVVAACGVFFDAVQDGTLRHISQTTLNEAVKLGRKRNLDGNWAWARAHAGADITPLCAATNALWAVQSSKVRKKNSSSTTKPRRAIVWR